MYMKNKNKVFYDIILYSNTMIVKITEPWFKITKNLLLSKKLIECLISYSSYNFSF